MEPEPCRYLEWDSNFFGIRVARLTPTRLSPATVQAAEQWCRDRQIDCLYLLADPDDPLTVRTAEQSRFELTDVRVTSEARLAGAPSVTAPVGRVRRCREEDIPVLRELARVSHRDSRFYFDPRFPDEVCDRLYETWLDKSCRGWADAVLVAELDSGPVGYATVHRDDDRQGRLGLLAVDASVSGQGLGQRLVAAVLDWGRSEHLATMSVVTQGRNSRALRLYARCGFLPRSIQLWYHRWFSHEQAGGHRERGQHSLQ